MIQKKWKSDAIGKIIQQSLGHGNKQQIRLLGFEILLYFIQANRTVTNEQIDELIVWFSTAVNMKPFIVAYQQEGVQVRLKNSLPDVKDMDSQVCPANTEPTKDDAKVTIFYFQQSFTLLSGIIKLFP